MNRLTAENVSFRYPGREPLLKGIGFRAGGGELVSLIGPNGAGKTTLLKCLLGLLRCGGDIRLDGTPVRGLSPARRASLLAYIPQHRAPGFSYPAIEVVLMGAAPALPWYRSPGRAERERAAAAMEEMGVYRLREQPFDTLSGGEQQLCMMARAMMADAKVWLLDEPAASLDYGNTRRLMERLQTLAGDGYLILQSIHAPETAAFFSTRVLALRDGRLIADGKPDLLDEGLIERLYGVKVRRRTLREPDGDFPVFLPPSR